MAHRSRRPRPSCPGVRHLPLPWQEVCREMLCLHPAGDKGPWGLSPTPSPPSASGNGHWPLTGAENQLGVRPSCQGRLVLQASDGLPGRPGLQAGARTQRSRAASPPHPASPSQPLSRPGSWTLPAGLHESPLPGSPGVKRSPPQGRLVQTGEAGEGVRSRSGVLARHAQPSLGLAGFKGPQRPAPSFPVMAGFPWPLRLPVIPGVVPARREAR